MSVPAHIAQTLTDLRARRDFLNTAIDVLSQIWEGDTPAPADVAVSASATDRRATSTSTPRAEKSIPRATPTNGDDPVLAAIKRAGGSVAPGELGTMLKIDRQTLRRKTAALIANGLVIATGVTAARRLSLPDYPAKEAP